MILLPTVFGGLFMGATGALHGWGGGSLSFPETLASLFVTAFSLFLLALLIRTTVRYARTRTSVPPDVPSGAVPSAGGSPPSDQPLAR